MHRLATQFVLGFHGCEGSVADALLAGKPFRPSRNDWDWLGHGIYFWEANPRRGLEWASELKKPKPTVLGAVIDLGLCLDLTTSAGISQVVSAFDALEKLRRVEGRPLPANVGGSDRLRRNLDCAVLNTLHDIRIDGGLPPVDTVKGVFQEGGPAYKGSDFHVKTHIQVCVRNPACIKGVFRVSAALLDQS